MAPAARAAHPLQPAAFRSSAPAPGAGPIRPPAARPTWVSSGRPCAALRPRRQLWSERRTGAATVAGPLLAGLERAEPPGVLAQWTGPRRVRSPPASDRARDQAVDPAAEIVTAGLPDSNRGVRFASSVSGMFAAGARAFDTLASEPVRTRRAGCSTRQGRARGVSFENGDNPGVGHGARLGDRRVHQAFRVRRSAGGAPSQEPYAALAAPARTGHPRSSLQLARLTALRGRGDFFGLHTGCSGIEAPSPAFAFAPTLVADPTARVAAAD